MSIIRSMLLLATMLLAASTHVFAGQVDINTADAGTLASAIDGVGERKAQAIVEHRQTNGPFASVDELANVKGIGIKTVENNRDSLTVGAPAH
ncbi:MAG: helix-hairpin-helix domain-containing protein [Gammaproteobacteria bacterium]|nr:helix-hairpin-helix domain-containing protein [Gammaproteobacteria bacterium]